MSDKHQHLQFLQDVIARMSNHGFLLKGWMITIVAGLVALSLSLKPQQPKLAFVSLAVITLFWLLDGYFLWREKQFIEVCDNVREL